MRFTVDYGTRPHVYPSEGFAAFIARSDAREFARLVSQVEPGISLSVYEDGNLIETFKTEEDEA